MNKLSTDQVKEVMFLYSQGISSEVLGRRFGISSVAIRGLLKRRSITIRNNSDCQRRLPLHQEAFSIVTPESAYWIGFLMADGCIRSDRNELSCNLTADDIGHLEKLKCFLGATHAIIEVKAGIFDGYNSRPAVRFSVKSKRIVDDLSRFGVVENKSHTACVRELGLSRDFWRGVIDGDGHFRLLKRNRIKPNLPFLELYGSSLLVGQFRDFVYRCVEPHEATVRPSKSVWRIQFLGSRADKIIRLLYEGADVALERKQNAARNILERAWPGTGQWSITPPIGDVLQEAVCFS